MSTSTPAENENPIQKWGLSTHIRNLDTIMICLTSSHTRLSRADVTALLRRRDPSKYGAMTIEDVKEVFNFYFTKCRKATVPWGLLSSKVITLRAGGTPSEVLVNCVEQNLADAEDELGMGGRRQGKMGKETQQVDERVDEGEQREADKETQQVEEDVEDKGEGEGAGRSGGPSQAGPVELNEEQQLLLKLKEEENLPWKDIAVRFQTDLGKSYQVPALQKRFKRLRERLAKKV